MTEWLEVVAMILVVFALVPAMAHALELPGKLRLDKDEYLTVQPIYYPGFTFAGIAEPVAIIVSAVLLVVARDTAAFGPTLTALLALIGAHAVYWLVTHPVNKFWLNDEELAAPGARFFAAGGIARGDWTRLRDRWEYSHVARALLTFSAFVALAVAVSGA
ncbi:MAG: DUF1772 domain-containing protein [Betaproteobacteria bacterium]|nr:DUF1772 domain-containing protein [Betaproteobacteria bacterium]